MSIRRLGIVFSLSLLFGIPSLVLAQTCTEYQDFGLSCSDSTSCDTGVDAVDNVTNAYGNVKIGSYKKKEAFITGICEGTSVCCIKKVNDDTSTVPAPATPAAAPTPVDPESECDAICQYNKDHYGNPYPNGNGIIPTCAFSGTCRNVNDLLQLVIYSGKYVFGIIGTVALVAFVFGGFTMIFSFGSADRVKKGRDILVAAVIGLVIAFSAYLIVNFILDALHVGSGDPTFKAIK